MSRDRYEELRAIRKESLVLQEASSPNYSRTSKDNLEIQKIYNDVSEVEDRIEKLHSLANKVSRMHEENLVIVDPAKEKENDVTISRTSMEISKEIVRIKSKIKEIGIAANQPSGNTGDNSMKKGRHMALLNKFREEIDYIRSSEKDSEQKYRNRIAKQIRIVDPGATEDQINSAIDTGNARSVFQLASINYQGTTGAKRTLEQVELRNEEVKKIEKNIVELNDLFVEVQEMAEKQQEGIDNIESAVINTENYTVMANEQIDEAVQYRRSTRKKLWFLFALALILLVAVILLIVFLVVKK